MYIEFIFYIIFILEFLYKRYNVNQNQITTSKEYSSRVYGDLTKKNAMNLLYDEKGNVVNLSARLPLAKLSSYSSELRKLTSGNTTFTIEFD